MGERASGGAILVCDAQPLVALIAGEPTAQVIREHLAASVGTGRVMISAVNWCEVIYAVMRRSDLHTAARISALVSELAVDVVDVDSNIAGSAAAIKAEHGLGLGDAFAASLALALGAPLMTGDRDFLSLQERGLELVWVGRR